MPVLKFLFLVLIIACTTFYIIWIVTLKWKKRISGKQLFVVIALSVTSLLLVSVNEEYFFKFFTHSFKLGTLFFDYSIFIGLFFYLRMVFPVATVLYMGYLQFFKKQSEISTGPSEVESFIEKVLSNEKFNTAFNNVLPKGNNDEELGLGYIPIMLQITENRRKKFSSDSNRFLAFTFILGTLFIMTVTYFGYVL
ncbi:MAG: hypothetical protein ACTHMC_12550, partial [Pseudobacter sp.]|uniref:hypothetical protein n=1 Tax=Pseudobacter sp. TaxID=2045420 RepID=UPI003F7F8C7B